MTHARLIMTAALVVFLPIRGMSLTWRWSNPMPHGNDILAMAWNGSLAEQATDRGQVYYSEDLVNWLPGVTQTTNDLLAVAYYGDRVIITGANGTVGYSDDGQNFTTTSLNTSNWLVGVAASGTQVVAVGDNAVIYTSSDGASWSLQSKPPGVGQNWLLAAAWGNGVFVITGEGGYVASSSDGIHWTNHSSGSSDDLECVAYISSTNGPGTFPYAGFYAASYGGKAYYSTNNGVNWRAFTLPNSTNALFGIAGAGASVLLAGDQSVFYGRANTNVLTWTNQAGTPTTDAPAWTYYGAAWDTNSGQYTIAGVDGMIAQGLPATNTCIWDQEDSCPRDWLWQVGFFEDLYVAVGDHARIMTSDNGVGWSTEALAETNSISSTNTVFFCVGGTSNLLIAAGNHGSLAISPNVLVPVLVTNEDGSLETNYISSIGVLWDSLPAPTTNDLAGVCSFSNQFYLAGSSGTLLCSADGTNWTARSVPSTNYLSGIAAMSNTLAIVGDQGAILTSPDGTNWTKHASGTTNWLFRLRCMAGRFIAVGENGTIMQSTNNGAGWFSTPSGVTGWINDAVLISNACYLVGNQGTVLASTDFTKWTNAGSITSQSLYGAATQNGQLLAVGLSGTILRSQVIPDMTPPVFVSYAQGDGENVFLVAGVPDQQFTLDYSQDLSNWVTGPLLDLIYDSGELLFYTELSTNPPPAEYYRCTLVP